MIRILLVLSLGLLSAAQQSCTGACGKAISVNGVIECYCHDQCLANAPGPCCVDFTSACPLEYEQFLESGGGPVVGAATSQGPLITKPTNMPEGCEAPESNVIPVPDVEANFEKAGRSCADHCGHIMVDGDENVVCYCDNGCLLTGDCCADFIDVCEVDPCILAMVMPTQPDPTTTCKDNCGVVVFDNYYGEVCSCEPACVETDTCCTDYKDFCPLDSSIQPLKKEVSPTSCYSKCGGRSDACWCDYQCLETGDCCDDYLNMCGAEFSLTYSSGFGSCHNKCGGAGFDCWCDEKCVAAGDCCKDYLKKCDAPVYG